MIGVVVKTVLMLLLLLLFLCAESECNISQLKAFMAWISFREKGKTETRPHLILTKMRFSVLIGSLFISANTEWSQWSVVHGLTT